MAVGEYLLCFSEKCNKEDVKQYFINCLSRENFSVTRQEFEGKTLLITSAPFSVLAEKAEEVGLEKATTEKKAFILFSIYEVY